MNEPSSDPSQNPAEPPSAAEPPAEQPARENEPQARPARQSAPSGQSSRGNRDQRRRNKPQVLEGLSAHVGSLRGRAAGEGGAAPSDKPAAPPTPAKSSYPPPRVTRISPELEQEIEAALGEMSVDEVLADKGQRAATGELEPDTRVTGAVVAVHREDVFFDLGGPVQGVVPLRQFAENPEQGQTFELIVTRYQAEEGLYECTRPGAAIDVEDWSDIAEGSIVDTSVTGHNKGGLECKVGNLRGFMPVSQVSLYRVEDLEEFVGQSFPSLVTEANPERRNLVLSRRAVLEREQAEAKEKLLEELAPGQTREGVVRSLQDFGAFVDLGGVDGLIHISQLSWERVRHPSEVLQLGQRIKVKVEKINPETGKIGLSYRENFKNPWEDVDAKYPPHSTHRGTVSKITDFGAFVRLEPGIEGLIHISELAHQRVRRVSDVVSEGQQVDVKILSVDKQSQRISLSLKALAPEPLTKEQQAEEKAIAEIEAANKPPKKQQGPLKGGISRPSGGEKFGLKW